MHLYHYTSVWTLPKILESGALLSEYGILARLKATREGISESRVLSDLLMRLKPKRQELLRKGNVFLATSTDMPCHDGYSAGAYARGDMVVLEFKCPYDLQAQARSGDTVHTSRLDLEHLLKLFAQQQCYDGARRILDTDAGGRYKHIPLAYWRK